MTKIALDTNILVYMHENDTPVEQAICERLVIEGAVISAQTVSEYINVLRRKLAKPKEEILEDASITLSMLHVQEVDEATLGIAARLIRRYQFQIFDAIIVASVPEAQCDILYSEDMQHNLLVEGRLRIINPFL